MHKISGNRILHTIQEICAFGPRWMGSKGADKTVGFIASTFAETGLKPETPSFRYLSYTPESASLEIDGRPAACEPIALAPSTPTPLKGPILYGGQCSEEDLRRLEKSGADLARSIVLSDNLRSFVACPIVEEHGAAGFISMTNLADNTIRCGCGRLDRIPGKIPGVSIGGEDGRRLIQAIQTGNRPQAVLDVHGRIEETDGRNVQTLPASPKLLITAHYDSFWNGVHAMDNASGVAAALEICRRFSSEPDFSSVGFVIFGGEELGCWGSSAFTARNRNLLENLTAVVNLDTFGTNRSQLEIGVTHHLEAVCRQVAAEMKIPVDCWNIPPRAASDQHEFVRSGVPAIWIANCGSDPRYHTPLDEPSEMSAEKLETAANLAVALVRRLIRNS